MEDVLVLLIPVIGVSIPLVVVAGRFIVQPIVHALIKQSESRNTPVDMEPVRQRLGALEDRLEKMERSLDRLVEESEFHRQLSGGRPTGGSMTEPGSR